MFPSYLHCNLNETLTESSSAQFTVETVSYFVSEGPGSLLKNGGGSMDRSLFIDTQLDIRDSAPSSSSSKSFIFWSLRGEPVTLETHTQYNKQSYLSSYSFLLVYCSDRTVHQCRVLLTKDTFSWMTSSGSSCIRTWPINTYGGEPPDQKWTLTRE